MMRLVVISEGESLDSEVAEDFGHAPFFLVVDSESLDYHVIENEFADSPEGAGVAVAKAITTLRPDAVITGGIGMHGLTILRDAKGVAAPTVGTVVNVRLAAVKGYDFEGVPVP